MIPWLMLSLVQQARLAFPKSKGGGRCGGGAFLPHLLELIFGFFLATKGVICLILQNVTEAVGSGAAAHVFLINECVYSWKEVKMGLCYIRYLLKH